MENPSLVHSEDSTDTQTNAVDVVDEINPEVLQQHGFDGDLTDEYHYVKSGEYTSEIYKVVVQNVPRHLAYGRLRSTLVGILGFMPKKTKYNPSNNFAFLCFQNNEERQKALELLHNHQWKDNVLICKKAPPAKDPFVKERKRKAEELSQDEIKKAKYEEYLKLPPEERILEVVCPYAKLSYEEQVKKKEKTIGHCIDDLTRKLMRELKHKDPFWLEGKSLCLDLLPIVKSPVVYNYRNKVEFTIGVGPDGKDNTVGFRLGSYKEGSMLIVEPFNCINCSKESLTMAKEFQTFIQTLPYPSYNIGNHVGFWQQLIVRSSLAGDMMLIIQVFPSFMEKQDYELLKRKVIEFVSSNNHIASLYMSFSSKRNNNIDTFEHLYGEKFVKERLLGLQFQISPESFFQVNTKGAEMLYQLIKDWCDIDNEDSCVLDVCCGTGTIGLCIAHNSKMPVLGVEICQQAVDDAKENAAFNGVENATFICGPAQKVLQSEIRKIRKTNVIAVVDPPRAGLHRQVLSLLRSCSAIRKIIYVSCSPKQAAENFISLCRPQSKKFKGTPFKTTRAVPVDLFPHTQHCELIVELQRVEDSVKPNSPDLTFIKKESPDSSIVNNDSATVLESTNPSEKTSPVNDQQTSSEKSVMSTVNTDTSTVNSVNAVVTESTNPLDVT